MESVENQKQVSHASHRPLEISQTPRDFHIPTAQRTPDGKVENQTQVSHFSTRRTRRRLRDLSIQNQKPRKDVGRYAASFPIFMLILHWKRNPISCSFFDWKMLSLMLRTRR